jgi:hypothetical protein
MNAMELNWIGLDVAADYTLHISFPGSLTHNAYGTGGTVKDSNGIRFHAGESHLFGPEVPVNMSILTLKVPRNETAAGSLRLTCDTIGW